MVITKSVLIPIHLIPESKFDAYREAAIAKVIEEATAALKGQRLVVRDLMPTDLGLSNEVWYETTGATANQWENSDIADKEVADNTFVCIWGVTDLGEAPAVSALKFTIGGAEQAIWNLDKMIKMEHRAAIALSPLIISQNIALTIEHYVKQADAGVEIAFDGVVCEKEGLKLKVS